MSGFIKISDAASLALHALAYLAQTNTHRVSTKEIATKLNVSEAHLAKVMQRLEHDGFVNSKRGPSGGFIISQDPSEVSLYQIYESIEGKVKQNVCLLGQSLCNDECPLGHIFHKYEDEMIRHMKKVKLREFSKKSGVIIEGEKAGV